MLSLTRDRLKHLEVKKSTIPNAGLGVYLKKGAPTFAKDAPLMRYYGKTMEDGEQTFGPYLLRYGGGWLDPLMENGELIVPSNKLYPANPGPRVNDARDDRNQLRYGEAMIDEKGFPFVLMTLNKGVREGEELFAQYGAAYWANWS